MKAIDQANLTHHAIFGLEKMLPEYSLHLWIKQNSQLYFQIIPLALLILVILFPNQIHSLLFLSLNILYLIMQLFKLLLVILGSVFSKYEQQYIPTEQLPIYSILLPAYLEYKVIQRLLRAISELDYPKHLLDVKLLIEEDDHRLLKVIKATNLPRYIEIILVPASGPRTKPKACNYGLQFTWGKYIVIFDADDHPDRGQLKQAVAKFAHCAPQIICLQAGLNYYNRQQNYLSKLFSIEYSLLFDYILHGLIKLDLPIPLGGSSNHFIRAKLEELGGWDAFNVTEDADLGVRLYQCGYRIDLLDSITLEESPINLKAWIKQRSRWIKGHMLTSLLYLKQLPKANLRFASGLLFYLYIPNLTYALLPLYIILSCFTSSANNLNALFYFNIALSIFLPMTYSIFILHQKKWLNMHSTILLSIGYYFIFSLAAMRSCWQILKEPFYWDKTEHGVYQHNSDLKG